MNVDPPDFNRIITALERIADALDNLAALHAAGPALKAAGGVQSATHHVIHLDGNPYNNDLSNLRLVERDLAK